MSDAELIRQRFVEAADVERRLPRVSGPRAGSYWPGYDFSEEERKAWVQADVDDDRQRWAARRDISAAELSRYGEVISWTVDHIPTVSMRRLAWEWAFCQAIKGRSFVAACNKNGWVKSTAYARLERLWSRLAVDLVNVSIFLRPPRGWGSGQDEPLNAYSDHRLQSCASASAVPSTPYRTENSRDLIRSQQDADAFSEWLVEHNKAEAPRRKRMAELEAKRREKLGISEDAA